jgi:hypothetical protein
MFGMNHSIDRAPCAHPANYPILLGDGNKLSGSTWVVLPNAGWS